MSIWIALKGLMKPVYPVKICFMLSSLNNTNINDKDYEHALKVWETFQIKTMGEYHVFLSTN